MSSNMQEKKQNNDCFIIMPISDPPGYDNGHFKRVYDDIFKPACIDAGLTPLRSDDVAETGMIHIRILQQLLNSSMAICDLSSHNPNVLFELGIRQAFDKPTILVQEEGTKPIFDIAPLQYYSYKSKLLYRDVIDDQKAITTLLKNTSVALEKGEIVNSIVKLLNISKATTKESSTDNTTIAYSYILSEINQLKNEFRKITPSYQQSFDSDEFYSKILLSIKQLGELLKNGVSSNIFNKNYYDLREQILSISDLEIRSILMDYLDDMKNEYEKFM